jgi:hypothetical protein
VAITGAGIVALGAGCIWMFKLMNGR